MKDNTKNTDKNKIAIKNDARKLFLKKGTCSAAFFHILNREFEQDYPDEVRAADILAGGISRQGFQCGMLWGSALAAGAQASRREKNIQRAIELAMKTSKRIVESFLNRSGTVECSEITSVDWTSPASMAKYAVTGKFMTCFNLSRDWAPDAVESAMNGLNENGLKGCLSCASEVLKKSGASEREQVMVAGFGGGLGLSQNGCGALAAALWYRSLQLLRDQGIKPGLQNPDADQQIKMFYRITDYKMICSEITQKKFKDEHDHGSFIKKGGCSDIIHALSDFLKEQPKGNLK